MEEPSASETSRQTAAVDMAEKKQRQKVKKQVCEEVIRKLQQQRHPYTLSPNFAEDLLAHFMRLPTRYAMDVNTERAEDVLTHMRLLDEAKRTVPSGRPVLHIRAVRLAPSSAQTISGHGMEMDEQPQLSSLPSVPESQLALPAFGSTQNLEQPLPQQGGGGEAPMEEDAQSGSSATSGPKGLASTSSLLSLHLHEITFSTVDKPKLLSQLSAFLADVGLNIREAHVFSTTDGLSLDVFVVDGWLEQDPSQLCGAVMKSIQAGALDALGPAAADAPANPQQAMAVAGSGSSTPTPAASMNRNPSVPIPSDGKDDWEIDSTQLKLHHKIASGSFGDLFRGTYCGQDVAIKILKPERLNDSLQQEFAQEVFIMRKVRHKNVVQFIGACTKPPNLSIVTEFMSGGSVFDYLHKHKGSMKPPMLIRVALDVAKGMDFLHRNHIIHRDLKAANLLMDENEVVKVADFGVARVQASSGIMTAETGTYRWMAPEVIEHRAYDHKADVFSYGITLWELLTGKIPYSDLTPLQAAVSVVQKGLRPPIPKGTHPKLAELMERCWHVVPTSRPEFSEIIQALTDIMHEVEEDNKADGKRKEKRGGFFSALGKR